MSPKEVWTCGQRRARSAHSPATSLSTTVAVRCAGSTKRTEQAIVGLDSNPRPSAQGGESWSTHVVPVTCTFGAAQCQRLTMFATRLWHGCGTKASARRGCDRKTVRPGRALGSRHPGVLQCPSLTELAAHTRFVAPRFVVAGHTTVVPAPACLLYLPRPATSRHRHGASTWEVRRGISGRPRSTLARQRSPQSQIPIRLGAGPAPPPHQPKWLSTAVMHRSSSSCSVLVSGTSS